MAWTRCPEAVYGEHGPANTSGRCPYCGASLGTRSRLGMDARARRERARDQDPLTVDGPTEDDYYES